jgi:DNA helicase-2/ATP-dependent DNA helicase PcrA
MQQRIKVYGPPGTGKTKYCLDLLCEHLQAGDRVLFLSFTRAAKLEAEGRVLRAFGSVPEYATIKTIHALCLKVLNISADSLFEKPKTSAKFYGSLNSVYRGNSKRRNGISEALAYHNYLRNVAQSSCDTYQGLPFTDRQCTEAFVDHFEMWKRDEGYVDFTDLLVRVARGEGVVDAYDVVIIDEAQDLTTLQWQVVERLYKDASMVYVVGDDDQAIYSFLGADVSAFLSWRCDAMTTLDYTYRLPANVLDFSARLAIQIGGRQTKAVRAADRQGIILADINLVESLNYGTRATELFLTRNEYMLRRVERMLRRNGIPYKSAYSPYTSTKSYEGRAFRAIGALHTWRDTALSFHDWRKIKATLRQSFVDLIEDEHEGANEARPEGIPPLNELFRAPGEFEKSGWWEAFIPELSPQTTSMFKHTLSLNTVEQCLHPTLELSTIHGAKGQEADRVYVCSALTDKLHRGIETKYDEHRLFYVAVTRTKDELIILHDAEAGKNHYTFPPTEV